MKYVAKAVATKAHEVVVYGTRVHALPEGF